MTQRRNPFVRVKQFYVEDENFDMNWWIDEEDLESFKKNWCCEKGEDGPKWEDCHKGDTRELSGKAWNEWMIGSHWGDFEGIFMDEDCPECGCFLIQPAGLDEELATGKERHCSSHDCVYTNTAFDTYSRIDQDKWDEIRNAPEPPKFRIEGETVEKFAERHGIDLERMADKDCVKCKQTTAPNDWYQTKSYAAIIYGEGHAEDCDNKGCPATLRPLGEELDKWLKIL